jgi:FtsP/CotA-like multicopper oxidase with cupredoxin domain
MSTEQIRQTARPGDWVRVHGTAHRAPREGRIVQIVGPPGREWFRVRWEPGVEAMFVPSDGDRVTHHCPHDGNRA